MKRLTITLFILATLLLNMLPACDGLDDHYSTNPTYRLSFSTDTLAFDTIFSTIGSTTRQFMIYNKNPRNIQNCHDRTDDKAEQYHTENTNILHHIILFSFYIF